MSKTRYQAEKTYLRSRIGMPPIPEKGEKGRGVPRKAVSQSWQAMWQATSPYRWYETETAWHISVS